MKQEVDLTLCVGVIQLIQTVTAVDPDEPMGGQHFYYSLAPEAANNPNFTLRDNQGGFPEETESELCVTPSSLWCAASLQV